MVKLSLYDRHSIDEISAEFNFSKKLANNIRKYFGEPLSLFDLTQIKKKDFYPCKGLGLISWREFSDAVSTIQLPNEAVKLIEKSSPTKIRVEIDFSKSFATVIDGLSQIIKDKK